MKIDALFISDVHLGSKGCDAESLLKILKKYKPKQLFLVGDIIDGFYHPTKDIRTLVHGDDYVSSGQETDLKWLGA